jgi:hypothetical protein
MSLKVNPETIKMAESGNLTPKAFVSTIKESLPYAWETFSKIKEKINSGAKYAIIEPEAHEISEGERGELLRALSSTSIREALEQFFGFKLAFQNCHRTGGFVDIESEEYKLFTSMEEQILKQKPELVHC